MNKKGFARLKLNVGIRLQTTDQELKRNANCRLDQWDQSQKSKSRTLDGVGLTLAPHVTQVGHGQRLKELVYGSPNGTQFIIRYKGVP